jgi:hypothetical protein
MGWRDKYKVHPAADVFPMMSDEELKALGEDIKANGLRERIKFWRDDQLVEGRNRMAALYLAGIKVRAEHKQYLNYDADPVAYVISANIHRRHLTEKQQIDLIIAARMAAKKPGHDVPVSKGGRGKINPVKAAVMADIKAAGIKTTERTVKRRIAKAEGKTPKPKPRRCTKKEVAEHFNEQARIWKAAWLRDHPGRTPEEYEQILDTEEPGGDGPIWLWRRAMGRASIEAEREAWLRDHPDNPLPQHMCSLSDGEHAEYQKWRETYEPPEITVPEPEPKNLEIHPLNDLDQGALIWRIMQAQPIQMISLIVGFAGAACKVEPELVVSCIDFDKLTDEHRANLKQLVRTIHKWLDGFTAAIDERATSTLPQDGRSDGDPTPANGRAA